MSDLNDINRAIGSLEAKVETLTVTLERVADRLDGLQKKSWTARGVIAGLAVGGGAVGGKLAALLGMTPPGQP